MTPAERDYQRCGLRLIVARAQLLLQISGPDRAASLQDVVAFARVLGDTVSADTLDALRAAMMLNLQVAQAELDRLTGPAEAQR